MSHSMSHSMRQSALPAVTAGAHTRENRTARRVSVLLRERGEGEGQEGIQYQVVTSHETKLPHSSSEGGHGH